MKFFNTTKVNPHVIKNSNPDYLYALACHQSGKYLSEKNISNRIIRTEYLDEVDLYNIKELEHIVTITYGLTNYYLFKSPKHHIYFYIQAERLTIDDDPYIELSYINVFTDKLDKIQSYVTSFWEQVEKISKPKPEKPRLHLLTKSSSGSIEIRAMDLKDVNLNLLENYGSSFESSHKNIFKALSTDDSGLVLLYGKPGCGKTYYLRYLIKQLSHKFSVYYIPSYMCDMLSSPEFMPLLINLQNAILVIEDAERAIMKRGSGESSDMAVSNLLNISDGLLSDFLHIRVIATFNTERNNIDDALLRKGRLIAEHEFKELSVSESQLLLDKLNKSYTAYQPMTLAEIYNCEDMEHSVRKRRLIGFNV